MIGGSPFAGISRIALAWAMVICPVSARGQEATLTSDKQESSQPTRPSMTMAVPLSWGGQTLGDVIVQVESDETIAIESTSLRAELGRLLTEDGIRRLDETIAGDPFVTAAELAAGGFDVEFDLSRIELEVVRIDPDLRPIQPLYGTRREVAEPMPTMEPAGFSAFINANVNFIYRGEEGVVPPDIFLFGAARARGLVIEADAGFTQTGSDEYRFFRRGVRAVYDEPDKFRRWSAGDLQLENTGTFRTPFIGGVALEKSRRTFDAFRPAVNLGGRQILITSPSTVEVLVNGAPYQTLDLQPGTYSLDDLPIQTG